MAADVSWLGKLFQFFTRLAVPAVSGVRKLSTFGRAFYWGLHVLIVVAVLVGLYVADVKLITRAPFALPKYLAHLWAPILALIVYAFGWVVVWLWGLSESADEDEHSDITLAWEEASRALEQTGLDLTDLPLFLVLGEPSDGEIAFFQGSRLRPLAPPLPSRADSPIRIYALKDSTERKGLFVTCVGASLTGRHSRVLAGKQFEDETGMRTPAAGGAIDRTMAPEMTMAPGGVGDSKNVVQSILSQTRHRSLTGEELGDLERVLGPAAPGGQSVLRDPQLVRYHTARMRHLCRLIVRSRAPRCPANGLLLLLPLRGAGVVGENSKPTQAALDTGVLCRGDLAAVCEVFRLHVPTVALLCDLEKVEGQREFLSRFTAEDRQQRRIGQRVPLMPRFLTGNAEGGRAERMRRLLESLSARVCGVRMQDWLYHKKGFQVEAPGGDPDLPSVERHNGRLFQFFDGVHSHREGLAVILKEALVGSDESSKDPTLLPILFGGLYVAWTGYRPQEQGFYASVLERMFDDQDHVSWTGDVVAEEDRWARMAQRVYLCLTMLAFGYAAAIAFWIFKFKFGSKD
jgi:hypothetical protein